MKKTVLGLALLGALSMVFGADGAAIYKKCVACHGPTGKTVYAGKVPAQAGKDKAYVMEALKEYQSGKRNQFGMGAVMQAQAKIHLKSDEDIEAVADYISQLPE